MQKNEKEKKVNNRNIEINLFQLSKLFADNMKNDCKKESSNYSFAFVLYTQSKC